MLNLHLTKRQTEHLWDALQSSHRIKIVIHIHNEDEDEVNDFDFHFGTTHILSGSVQVDATQDVTRSLSITFLDPLRRFRWSPDRTSHGTLYSGDFISVKYAVLVEDDNRPLGTSRVAPKATVGMFSPDVLDATNWLLLLESEDQILDEGGNDLAMEQTASPGEVAMTTTRRRKRRRWFDIPVFWGPLTAYEANGPEITIEAQGKESLVLDPHFAADGYTLRKHQHTDDAIQEVLRRVGERRFRLPELPYRIGSERVVHPRSEPWKVIQGGETDSKGKKIPGLIHRTGKHPHHCFYDGAGNLRIKRLNKQPVFTFNGNTLLSNPDITYDSLSFINHVVVTGSKGKGKGKKTAKAEVSLPRHNPLSPWRLARNGKPRYLTMFVDADNLKSDRACRQRAVHLLNHHSKIGVSASFECLPIPMLEPNDEIRVETDDFAMSFPVKQYTIPLTSDASMSIGYNKALKIGADRVSGGAGPGGPGASGGHPNHHHAQSQ